MWSGGVIMQKPFINALANLTATVKNMQIDAFIFKAAPQPFDEDIVDPAAFSVHGDADTRLFEEIGKFKTGELAALVGVEYLRRAIALNGFLQSLDAETHIHAVGQTPTEYPAAVPVHNRHQIEKATLHGNISDVGAPHLIWPTNIQPSEQVGINFVSRVRSAGARFLINRRQADLTHQPADPFARHAIATPPQMPRHLTRAIIGRVHELFINQTHQQQV